MINVLEMFGEPITYGGQESVVYNMLSTLDLKHDYNIDLFTPYYADNVNLIKLIEDNNGHIYHKNIEFKTGDNRFLLKNDIMDFFEDIKKNNGDKVKHDVVHIHTGSLSSMCLYSEIAKRYGVKKVIVHAYIAGQNKESIFHKILKYILCLHLKMYADVYLGCSYNSIQFKWTNDIVKKAIIVRNGVDIEKYKFNQNFRKEIRDKYNLNNKVVLGNVSRFACQKNHIFMIDIMRELIKFNNNIILMLVGDGELFDEVKNYARVNGVCDNIVFAGKSSEHYKYYNAFDIFIMPSLYEGLSVASIEAQINSLPTFLSATISEESKISNSLHFLPINDLYAWINKIIKIINDASEDFRKNVHTQFEIYDRNNTFKIINDVYKP